MKKIICLVLLVMILCSGCVTTEEQIEMGAIGYYGEWISPDGVHYWISDCKMAPRYDSDGNLVIDK